MLADAVSLQGFETVARRHAEIVENPRLIQKTKFAKRDILDVGRQSPAPSAHISSVSRSAKLWIIQNL